MVYTNGNYRPPTSLFGCQQDQKPDNHLIVMLPVCYLLHNPSTYPRACIHTNTRTIHICICTIQKLRNQYIINTTARLS